jgi:hypothetical protein
MVSFSNGVVGFDIEKCNCSYYKGEPHLLLARMEGPQTRREKKKDPKEKGRYSVYSAKHVRLREKNTVHSNNAGVPEVRPVDVKRMCVVQHERRTS